MVIVGLELASHKENCVNLIKVMALMFFISPQIMLFHGVIIKLFDYVIIVNLPK